MNNRYEAVEIFDGIFSWYTITDCQTGVECLFNLKDTKSVIDPLVQLLNDKERMIGQ